MMKSYVNLSVHYGPSAVCCFSCPVWTAVSSKIAPDVCCNFYFSIFPAIVWCYIAYSIYCSYCSYW